MNSSANIPAAPERQAPQPARRFLFYWLPALAWLCSIALFSTRGFSAQNTGRVLLWVLSLLHIQVSYGAFLLLNYALRKCAHFTAYGMLSWLFFRAMRGPYVEGRPRWRMAWAGTAVAVCLATASADEFHQLFTPGRTGMWQDVVLDMMGALCVQAVVVFVASLRWQRRW